MTERFGCGHVAITLVAAPPSVPHSEGEPTVFSPRKQRDRLTLAADRHELESLLTQEGLKEEAGFRIRPPGWTQVYLNARALCVYSGTGCSRYVMMSLTISPRTSEGLTFTFLN